MKKTSKIILASAVLFTSSFALAKEEAEKPNKIIPGNITGAVTFVSDYTFRGISQTNEGPALQSNFDWKHDSGFYAGIWGSNIDFPATPDANEELDSYAGYTFSKNGFDFNLGGVYYAYPGVQNEVGADYFEYQGAISKNFDVASFTGSVNYSPDFGFNSGKATYYRGTVNIPLLKNFSLLDKPVSKTLETIETPLKYAPFKNYGILTKSYGFISNNIGLIGSIGHQTVENNTNYGFPDYSDWSVGASFALEGFNILVQYVGTDITKGSCRDGCDDKTVVSLSKSF